MPETGYKVVLPQSRVRLAYGVPLAAVDYIALQLQNTDGLIVESWTVDDPESDPAFDDPPTAPVDLKGDWELLKELFTEVHRRVTGWDRVLSDVEQALSNTAPIGSVPASTSTR